MPCSILRYSNVSLRFYDEAQKSISGHTVSKTFHYRLSIIHFSCWPFYDGTTKKNVYTSSLMFHMNPLPSRTNHILYWTVNWYFACFARHGKFMMQFNETWLRKRALGMILIRFRFFSLFIGRCETFNWIFDLIYNAVVMVIPPSQLVPKGGETFVASKRRSFRFRSTTDTFGFSPFNPIKNNRLELLKENPWINSTRGKQIWR